MKVEPLIAWYDFWVGVYWDRKNRRLYILPIPCIGFVIEFLNPEQSGATGQWVVDNIPKITDPALVQALKDDDDVALTDEAKEEK